MAALLLSRYCQFAMAGGDGAEPGCGEKMAARLLLAAAEFQQQPLVQRFAATLAATGDAVTALLQQTLSGTLAMDDLDAISARLQATGSPRVDAQTLSAIGGTSGDDHSVDTRQLLRLIELSKDISAAHERLVHGKHGLGRARYGLAVAGGSSHRLGRRFSAQSLPRTRAHRYERRCRAAGCRPGRGAPSRNHRAGSPAAARAARSRAARRRRLEARGAHEPPLAGPQRRGIRAVSAAAADRQRSNAGRFRTRPADLAVELPAAGQGAGVAVAGLRHRGQQQQRNRHSRRSTIREPAWRCWHWRSAMRSSRRPRLPILCISATACLARCVTAARH